MAYMLLYYGGANACFSPLSGNIYIWGEISVKITPHFA